ncbi:hypothetical protein [Ruania albidiflava]|uniref:hypothetical protein n=1 Tax=Ruania albidiflava TaxID=366586 RepID=UPI0023F53B7E|nr:hypothetical protein [Ruania albidiflava]
MGQPGMTGHLIVISSLPGVGKTSVAEICAARLGSVHLSIDAIEESVLACGLPSGWQTGVAAYEAARAMAEMTWPDVERRRARYAAWTDEVIELDAGSRTADETAEELCDRLGPR